MKSIVKVTLSAAATSGALLVMGTACGEDEPSEEPRQRIDSGSKLDAERDASGGRDAHVDADAPSDARNDRECVGGDLVYKEPGCDGGVAPVCEPWGDAGCFPITVCDCQGRTVQACSFPRVPYRSEGACPGDPADGDAPDVLDGGCPGDAWWYAEPGCDGGVQPRCVTSMDACAGSFCDCNGQTIVSGCGFSKVPFQHQLACVPADGGADAPSD